MGISLRKKRRFARRKTVKYRPKTRFTRLKVKKEIYRKTALITLSVILISVFSSFIISAYNNIKARKISTIPRKIKSINFELDKYNELRVKVKENLIGKYKGTEYSKETRFDIEKYFSEKYPYIELRRIWFNYILGDLKIIARVNKPVAYFYENSKKYYLLSNGKKVDRVYDDSELSVIIQCEERCLRKNFSDKEVNFIEFLKKNSNNILGNNFSVVFDRYDIYIVVKDKIKIRWGKIEYLNDKIDKLKEVISDIETKLNYPVMLDMRFFKSGKILVSQI